MVMQLYLVRHGIAVDDAAGLPDGLRALTARGRKRFHKTARAFGRLGHRLDLILTSPLVRAVQTAEILAGATDHREVAVLEELDPKYDVEVVRTAVAQRAGDAKSIAIVGHEPQLSAVLAALSGISQNDINLRKGAIVRVDATTLTDGEAADPRWWLKPKGGRVKGLPLQKKAKKARSAAKVSSRKPQRAAGKKRPSRMRAKPSPAVPAAPAGV
jgi:phosphohistidine phosphatase